MKKIIFICIFLLIVIIGISQYNKIYYSFYINGDSFKSSSIEDKSKLLNDRNFRENCSDNTFEKAVMLLYEDVISRGSVEDKIDLLDNSDFTHFSSDDLRKSLIESIVDTPDIPSITYNRFLFKVCRSIDFKIVADRIEEKKNILPSDVISKISSNLSYISKNSEDKKKWENIIERNSEDLKQVALEKANKYINDSNYENKVSFLRTLDYSKFLTIEMKEKLMDSILEITNSEEKLIYFLFEECNFENFELAGQVLEKKKFNFEANTLYKIKKEILNKKYNNSLAWIRIIENFTEEFEKKIAELAKPIIENKDFAEKINLYRRPDFIHFASDETKLQLIDSMTSLNNIHKNKLIHFLFNTCDKKEFDFITKRISETGCNWELSVFTEIKLNISRSYKEYNNEYLNSIVRNYKILRERKAELVFKKIKESSSLKEKIELTKSGDFSYASYDIRKQVAELLADTAIVSGSLDEKISVFETGNTKYTPQTTREKLLISIINDPKIEDNQLRDLLLVCKEKECSITFNKMVEKKTFLPQKYISRLIEIDTFRMVNKDDISKIFQENPIGKRQLVVKAREFLQYKDYNNLLRLTNYVYEILKIKLDDSIYNDIVALKNSLRSKMPFRPNQIIPKSETELKELNNIPIIKSRVLEHFNKVLAEYDEEIKNSSHPEITGSNSNIDGDVRPGVFERMTNEFFSE